MRQNYSSSIEYALIHCVSFQKYKVRINWFDTCSVYNLSMNNLTPVLFFSSNTSLFSSSDRLKGVV